MSLLTSNEQVLIWGEGRQGTDADVTVLGTVASINTMGTTEVEDDDDDDELMLNVLRCHLTY